MKKNKLDTCGFVISFNGPYYSNFVSSIFFLEQKMQEKGIKTVYIFPLETKDFKWMTALRELNDKVYFINYNPRSINNFYEIRKIFKREKVNLIYSRMCGWDFTARFAFPFKPVIWHMDMNVNIVNRKRRILNWIKFKIIGFGKTFHIGVSQSVTNQINYFKPHNRCVPIINSIDFSRLTKSKEYLPGNPRKCLLFGWAPIIKGLDTTLDAIELLNKNSIDYELMVSSQKLTEEYLTNKYNESYPNWLHICEPTDDVTSLYDNADIMISASRSESFSFCVAEAIYSGLPVVCSDIDGTKWAAEFNNVEFFETGNSEDLAKKIDIIKNAIISCDDIIFNQELMMEKYSIQAWASKIIAYLETIA